MLPVVFARRGWRALVSPFLQGDGLHGLDVQIRLAALGRVVGDLLAQVGQHGGVVQARGAAHADAPLGAQAQPEHPHGQGVGPQPEGWQVFNGRGVGLFAVFVHIDDAHAQRCGIGSEVVRLALLVLGMLFGRGELAACAQARGFNEFFCRTPTWARYAW